MAEFSPDLLLVVGADLTQLRQQLATIQREMGGIPPIQVQVQAPGAKEATGDINKISQSVKELQRELAGLSGKSAAGSFDNAARSAKELGKEVDALRKIEQRRDVELSKMRGDQFMAQRSRDLEEAKRAGDLIEIQRRREVEQAKLSGDRVRIEQQRDVELNRLAATSAAERIRIDQRRDVEAAKTSGDRIRIEQQRDVEMAALAARSAAERVRIEQRRAIEIAKLDGDRIQIQQRRDVEVALSAERAERAKVRAAKASADERLAIELKLEQQVGQLQAARARLNRVGQISSALPGGGGPELRQNVEVARAQIAQAQASVAGGIPISPVDTQRLRNSLAAVNQELIATRAAAAGADSALGGFFSRMGRYAQIATGLTLVYGTMRAVFAGVQEYIEVDQQLARIAATMDRNLDRTTVLRGAYELMVQANQTLGTSFSDAGKVVFELEKSLGNQADQIQAAFLPALTLMSLGEGNQTEILRTLIGVYKLFGDTLGNTTPQEKYLRISDALIASSAASIQDIDGFRTALQNVAPVAQQAGLSLETTLASLVILTNGMQSASRAGTGLRQLLVDLQTRPAAISKIFDVPFDPDKPLNATKLLDTIIKKIRELGTDSVKTQAMINAAFPDKRATLAFETLIALYPQYSKALNEVETSAGRTAAAQRELANTVSAALGRLTGSLIDEAIKNLNALFNIKPGESSGLVQFIDGITSAIKSVSETAQTAIIRLQQLLLLTGLAKEQGTRPPGSPSQPAAAYNDALPGVQGGPLPLTRRSPGASASFDDVGPTPTLTDQARAKLEQDIRSQGSAVSRLVKLLIEARTGLVDPNTAKQISDLERKLPSEQRLEAGRDAEFTLRNAQFAEASPAVEGQVASQRILAKLSEEILANKEAQLRFAALEEMASDRALSYANRIAAAQQILVERTRERNLAERDFESTAALRPQDIADIEQYRGKFHQAVEAQRRASEQLRELRRGDREESQKFLDDAAEIEKKITDLFVKVDVERARLKDSSGLERAIAEYEKLVNVFEGEAKKLPLSTDEADRLKALYRELGDAILRYWVDPLVEITQLDYENVWDKFNRGLDKAIRDAKELAGIASILGKKAPSVELVTERSLERQLGLDTIGESLQKFRNEIGFTREEWVANMAAMKAGAKDFLDLLAQGDDPDIPEDVRTRKRSAARLIRDKVVPADTAAITEQIKKDTQDSRNQLEGLRDGYGQVGAELDKYILARDRYGKSFKDLTPEEQKQVERLAKTTEQLKLVAAASGLVALGFSQIDAEGIAKRAADVSAQQAQIATSIEQMRVLNDAGEVARQQQEAFIQESSRATGDFVSFFTSKMRDAANTGADFWTLMGTLAEDTSRAMSSSLSDFFFDTFTGKLQTTGQLWSNFLTGMHRSLSDFMSKQLVRSFLNILTGTAGGEGGGSPTGGLIGSGSASALGGVIGGFGNLFQNAQAGGVSGSLFGLPPVPPSTVNVGLPPSSPDLEFAGFAPTSMYLAGRPATSGLIGTGGQASKELSSAGAILAAYTAAQSVIKLTSEISSEQDRNSGTGGLVGAGVGGAIGAFFGSTAIGAGAGGLLGSYLGGLFGSDAPPAGRFDEINRTISAVQSSLEAMITSSKSFTSLFNTLLSAQGGGSLAASSGAPVQLAVGGRNISGLTQSEFLSAVRANPSSLSASVQAGVNPSLLSGLNQEVVNAVLARIAALDQIGQQINETIADILAETVVPVPTGATSLETLKQQAVDFRAVVDQLIATNAAQTQALETQLAATTDPELVLQYTTTIKGLIEKRYQDETQLVQKFAGQLDSLATSLKNVSSSIEKQIFDLQLSNFGPTNPLAGLQLAQGKFDAAKAAFNANPTPENAQALQALVDPLLKSASEVFTRPSPEYRAIFNDVIGTLEEVKGAVDSQANDIGDALAAALGTSNSLQDLTQKNTAAMAADMKQLLAIVTASAAASGINLNAGTGILLPGTFPTQGQPVQPYQDTSTAGTGNQTAAGLTAAGVMGLLGSSGTAATSIIGLADKLGLTTWLKDSLGSLFTTTDPAINPATAANYYTGGGSDVGLVAPALPTFTIPEITIPNITLNLPDNFSYVGESYSFSDIGTGAYSPDYGSLAFQSGGHVPGAGSGDTVPAMLEPGEFVIPRRVAGPLRPFLENLIGGQKNIPTGPHGLHFATGGTVPFTAQDVQALLLLQALLGVNNNQIQTQQQIASNTQLTADILRQLAQRSGLSVAGSSMAAPTTPNLTVLSASPSGGLSLSSTPVPSTASPAPSSPAPSSPVPAGPQGTGTPSEFQSTLNSGKFGLQAVASAANVLGYQGVAQSAVGLAGLLSLYQGIQQGNPYMAAGGGLTAAQSLAGILSQPGVAQTLGLTPNQATWLGIISQGLGAATGAVGVVQGIQQGNYLQAGAGGVQTLGSVANILANPKIADFLGYGSGPLINQAGQFTPTLGGALGVAGGALGVVGGGLNIYQGIQSGSAAQIASGAYSTVLGASAISGAFGGPTLASLAAGVAPAATSAGTAATTAATAGISAITPAAATVGYIALPVAIALGIWAHQEAVEAAKKRSGILEGLSIRSAYAEAVPTILDSMRGVNDLAAISLMPGQQQTEALLSLRARLESGWAGLADVSHFISTKGVGTQQAISTIGRADTTQAELIARVGTPIIAAGLAQVYDALALRGQPVFGGAMQPTSNYDIAAILNANSAFAGVDPVKFQQALLAGQFAGILSNTAPGDFSSTIGAIFTANNPQFSQSSFGTALGLEPIAAPTGTDAAMVQQQMMASLAQRQESIAQTREYVQQTGDYSPISAIAPYVPGGTETLIRDALPAWGLNEYEVTRVLGPDALRTMTLMQIKSVMDALQQSTGSNYGMAAGGWVSPTEVRQPAWGRDTVLRLLEPGEFIVPSQIARANAGLLEGLISDGAVRSDYGSTISTAARSGDYRSAGGISQVALNIHPGAIQIDGAKDPRAVSREVLDTIEQNIRTGRLGHVIVTRVRQTRG